MTTKNETVLSSIDLDKLATTQFSKECMEILREFQRGDISYMEFRVSTALKSVEVLDCYRPHGIPSKPIELLKFEEDKNSKDWASLTLEKKNNIQRKVLDYHSVKEYLKSREKADVANHSNVHHLEETALILLTAGMIKTADKVWEVLESYPPTMGNWKRPTWYEKKREEAVWKNRTAEVDREAGQTVEPSGKDEGGVQERAVEQDGETSEPSHSAQAQPEAEVRA